MSRVKEESARCQGRVPDELEFVGQTTQALQDFQSHWGQTPLYLEGKLRVFLELFINLLSHYPGGRLRIYPVSN